jgi:hypothetical protein
MYYNCHQEYIKYFGSLHILKRHDISYDNIYILLKRNYVLYDREPVSDVIMKERLVFRIKTRHEDATPFLDTLKQRFPEKNESEIIRYSLMKAAA